MSSSGEVSCSEPIYVSVTITWRYCAPPAIVGRKQELLEPAVTDHGPHLSRVLLDDVAT